MSDIPEGVEDAVADLFDMVMEALDKWEAKCRKSDDFKQDVILNVMVNALTAVTLRNDQEPEFVLHALLSTFRVNGAFDDEPTVH